MLTFIIEPDEDKWHAYCPELKGCHTFWSTKAEAMQYLKEAVQLYLEDEIEFQSMKYLSEPEKAYA